MWQPVAWSHEWIRGLQHFEVVYIRTLSTDHDNVIALQLDMIATNGKWEASQNGSCVRVRNTLAYGLPFLQGSTKNRMPCSKALCRAMLRWTWPGASRHLWGCYPRRMRRPQFWGSTCDCSSRVLKHPVPQKHLLQPSSYPFPASVLVNLDVLSDTPVDTSPLIGRVWTMIFLLDTATAVPFFQCHFPLASGGYMLVEHQELTDLAELRSSDIRRFP